METAVFGLIGTLIGGLITAGVSLLNARKDIEIRRLEFNESIRQEQRILRQKDKQLRLERYADFLGAYRQALIRWGGCYTAKTCEQQ